MEPSTTLPEQIALSDEPLARAVQEYTLAALDHLERYYAGERSPEIREDERFIAVALQRISTRDMRQAVTELYVTPLLKRAARQAGRDPVRMAFQRGLLLGALAHDYIDKET